ncbi:hypothetical protein B296_00004641 [Ensete ventricosum]|uniref:protein O-GlcNAc transferase n=1 Tax=Ensete ventricosum TaxID=4639 RepID=A0A427B7B1_ENSVE|nr:hypothetical protein B296_00004641 [Ensete ventricosum]
MHLCVLQGNYADAIACYNEVLRIDPSAADGLVNRGNTFKEIGRVTEAIQDYVRAVSIRPNMAEAHANLASAYKDRYVSSDFGNHPLSHLMGSVFGMHNRENVEVHLTF